MPCTISKEEELFYQREAREKAGLNPEMPNLPWEVVTENGETLVACKTRDLARYISTYFTINNRATRVVKCPC